MEKEIIELIKIIAPLVLGSGGIIVAYWKHRKVKELEKDKEQDNELKKLRQGQEQTNAKNEVVLKKLLNIEKVVNKMLEIIQPNELKKKLETESKKVQDSFLIEHNFLFSREEKNLINAGKQKLIEFVYRSFIGNGHFAWVDEISSFKSDIKKLLIEAYDVESYNRINNKSEYKSCIENFIKSINQNKNLDSLCLVTAKFMEISLNYYKSNLEILKQKKPS